jgi:hypothetical protein
MSKVCKWFTRIFGFLYLIALLLLAIGTFGLFGQARDPLSGIFLIPLGMPWIFTGDSLSDAFRPWLAILAPALNLFILAMICTAFGRSKTR